MPLFEIETEAHIIISWAEDEHSASAVVSEAYPQEIKKITKQVSEAAAQEKHVDENGEEFQPALSGAVKTLCIPLEQPPMPEGQMCFFDKTKKAKRWCLMGRSY